MKDKKYTTYIHTQQYGMEGIGDMEQEYLTPKQIQTSIDRTSAYIEDCKLKGIYGKEYTTTIKVEHDSFHDDTKVKKSCESYKFEIFNIGDNDN